MGISTKITGNDLMTARGASDSVAAFPDPDVRFITDALDRAGTPAGFRGSAINAIPREASAGKWHPAKRATIILSLASLAWVCVIAAAQQISHLIG